MDNSTQALDPSLFRNIWNKAGGHEKGKGIEECKNESDLLVAFIVYCQFVGYSDYLKDLILSGTIRVDQ